MEMHMTAFSTILYAKNGVIMGYREDMKRCRAYIDGNLKEEVTPQALAVRSGYSFYHFCHVFRSVSGMSVGEYLRSRRMCQAAVELAEGASVTQAALCCGFDTPSGFTKRFGLSPSEYKKQKGGILHMKPEFKTMPEFSWTAGYSLAFCCIAPRRRGDGRPVWYSLELSPAAFAFDTFDEALYAARPASR